MIPLYHDNDMQSSYDSLALHSYYILTNDLINRCLKQFAV